MLKKKLARFALGALALCAATFASAATVTLDFEGLKNLELVQSFYGGGAGSAGSVGTDYGITFDNNAQAVVSATAGGTGSLSNLPSGTTALFFQQGAVTLNLAQGFTDSFSFQYSTVTATGLVQIFAGENGTGALIDQYVISALGTNCKPGDLDFCKWNAGGGAFVGTAHSIVFGGVANQIAYDNITFGNLALPNPNPNPNPTPEPGSLVLAAGALLALRTASRRRA